MDYRVVRKDYTINRPGFLLRQNYRRFLSNVLLIYSKMSEDQPSTVGSSNEKQGLGFRSKLILLAIVAVVAGGFYWKFGEVLSLDYLATKEEQLKTLQAQHPLLVYGISFLIYAVVTGLIPSAAALTLIVGWYFGFLRGVVLVSFASTTGATIAFLLSRYFFRDAIQQKFHDKLATFNAALEKDGAFYLFSLRLIPLVPFFVLNAVMGLTPIRVWTFWWVSQIGMLAGTMVFVYAGSSVPDLMTLSNEGIQAVFSTERLAHIFLAFGLLGIFPLAIKLLMKKFSPQAIDVEETT